MGARYRKLLKNQHIIKTDFLIALERIANRSSIEDLKRISEALQKGVTFNDLLNSLSQGDHGVSKQELKHVTKDWFSPETGWWKEHKPEGRMRDGLLRGRRSTDRRNQEMEH